jgi:hypothetical protein
MVSAGLGAAGILMSVAVWSAQTTPAKDQWGSNSPGAKLEFKELDRVFVSDRTIVTYNLFASGLPQGEHGVLLMLRVGGQPLPVADAYTNSEGKIVSVLADPKRHVNEDPINIKVFGGKGEPFKFGYVLDDDRLRAFGQVIPFPMEAISGPCRLTAIQLGPYYSSVLIGVTGLQPHEELAIENHSGSEGGQTSAMSGEQGNYSAALFPFVKGKDSGKARFDLMSKSCKIGIEFPWGNGSYKYQ